jgi:ParB family chromosome partitioning protein
MFSDLDARAVAAAGTTEPTCAAAPTPLTRAQRALALARKLAATSQGALADIQQRRCDAAQLTAVRLRIDLLKPHPRQAETFADMPDEQIEILARDIEENGLQHPIEVLPDYTIIAGHCRVEAARRNGWTEIDAIIRYDLAAQGEFAVEQYMIRDNLARRQMDLLSIARAYKRMKPLCKATTIPRGDRQLEFLVRTGPSAKVWLRQRQLEFPAWAELSVGNLGRSDN